MALVHRSQDIVLVLRPNQRADADVWHPLTFFVSLCYYSGFPEKSRKPFHLQRKPLRKMVVKY
jgi:hypothetical protein